MPTDTTKQLARWRVSVAPTAEIITAADVSNHIKGSDINPAEVDLFIAAAIDYAEERMSCSLAARTIVASFYDGEPIILPRGPVIEILSIEGAGSSSTDRFTISNSGHATRLTLLQTVAYPLAVTYRAGYESPAAVPASIRLAILQHVATLYENRESIADKAMMPVPHTLADFYQLKARGWGIG